MALADIFNSTFFLVLGIVLLLFGLLVMYFETKLRDQNHKISSMVSLVSAMAEEVKGVRMKGGPVHPLNNMYPFGSINSMNSMNSMNTINSDSLIPVSDGEDDDDDDDDDEDDDEEDEDDDDDDDEDEDEDQDEEQENNSEKTSFKNIFLKENNIGDENMKIFNFKKEDEDDLVDLDNELDDIEDLENDLENDFDNDLKNDFDEEKELNEIIHNSTELEDLSEIELNHSFPNNGDKVNMDFLKTIHISNLEEDENQNMNDFKKLSLNKLRNVVVEKGLVTDASKMKKPDLLKLLGIE